MKWPIFYERGLNFLEPWRELHQLQLDLDSLLRKVKPKTRERALDFPPINIWSNDNEVLLTAEIPGISIEDLDLTVQHDQLTIKGNRKPYETTENEVFHRQERSFGKFIRTIALPFSVEQEKVNAKYRNGVLTVTLPRAEHDKPKQIKIKSS